MDEKLTGKFPIGARVRVARDVTAETVALYAPCTLGSMFFTPFKIGDEAIIEGYSQDRCHNKDVGVNAVVQSEDKGAGWYIAQDMLDLVED